MPSMHAYNVVMAMERSEALQRVVEAARTELVGHGHIVGVALGEREGLSVLVSEPLAQDRLFAERWGARHGVGVDMKVIGAVVLI